MRMLITAVATTMLATVLTAPAALAAPQQVAAISEPAVDIRDARDVVGKFLSGIDAPGAKIAGAKDMGDHFLVEVQSAYGVKIVDIRVNRAAADINMALGGKVGSTAEARETVTTFLTGLDAPGVRVGKVRQRDGHYEVEVVSGAGVHIVDLRIDAATGEMTKG